MTTKDYIKLANALKQSEPVDTDSAAHAGWFAAVLSIADALELDNPKFNRDIFIEACK